MTNASILFQSHTNQKGYVLEGLYSCIPHIKHPPLSSLPISTPAPRSADLPFTLYHQVVIINGNGEGKGIFRDTSTISGLLVPSLSSSESDMIPHGLRLDLPVHYDHSVLYSSYIGDMKVFFSILPQKLELADKKKPLKDDDKEVAVLL